MVNGGPHIVEDGLVLCLDAANTNSYPGTGTTWFDLSGRGNHATLYSVYGADPNYFPRVINGAMQFNSTNVAEILSLNFSTSSYTVIGASRYIGTEPHGRIITSRYNNWLMGHWNSATTEFYAEGWVSQTNPLNDLNWRIYCGMSDTITRKSKFYVNGNLLADNTNGFIGPKGIQIGNGGYTLEYAEGSNCECAFLLAYNRTLSPDEILHNYNSMKGRFNL